MLFLSYPVAAAWGRHGWKDCCVGLLLVAPPVQLLQGQPAKQKKEGVGPLFFMPFFFFLQRSGTVPAK